jgi:hypothetical protein
LDPVVEDLGVIFCLQQQNIVGHGTPQATLAGEQEHVSKLDIEKVSANHLKNSLLK